MTTRPRNSMSRNLRVTCSTLLLALLAACAQPADPTRMTVAPVTGTDSGYPPQFTRAGCVRNVTGGEETNPLWVSKLGDADFSKALSGSMTAAGLIGDLCAFPVDVNLLGQSQPAIGFDLTVTAHANYKVYDKNAQPVLLETITAPYTAGFSESPIAVIRLQRANEGAVRESISQFLRKLRGVKPGA